MEKSLLSGLSGVEFCTSRLTDPFKRTESYNSGQKEVVAQIYVPKSMNVSYHIIVICFSALPNAVDVRSMRKADGLKLLI